MVARVSTEGGRLAVHAPGIPLVILHAEGEERFYAKGFYLKVQVMKDAAGKVTGVVVEQYSGSVFMKKVG